MKRENAIQFLLRIVIIIFCCCLNYSASSQEVNNLIKNVKARLNKVNDYVAEGVMKTDVVFIKAPITPVKILYKQPNKFKLKRKDGISLLPKGGITLNMSSLLGSEGYTAIGAGEAKIGNSKVKIIKLLPNNESNDIVLTTMYIDPVNYLILKATSTTKENGTYETRMTYGRYAAYGLPDKMVFEFSAKDFKLPKGLTLEFDTGEKKPGSDKVKLKKGSIEVLYSSYLINKGIPDSEFMNK